MNRIAGRSTGKKLLIESKVTILFIYIACISLTCGILFACQIAYESSFWLLLSHCFLQIYFSFGHSLSLSPIRFPSFRYSLEANGCLGWFNRKLNVVPFHYVIRLILGCSVKRITPHANHFLFLSAHISWLVVEGACARTRTRGLTISNGSHIHGRRTHRLIQPMDTCSTWLMLDICRRDDGRCAFCRRACADLHTSDTCINRLITNGFFFKLAYWNRH